MSHPEYIRLTEEKNIQWFLDNVLVTDIQKVIDAGAGYLAFSLIAQAVELLGALLDEEEIHASRLKISPDRFARGIDEVFKSINPDYARHNKADSPFYLYDHLRCGMAHVLRPKTRVIFTGRADARKLGFKHLEEITLAGYTDTQLVLVIEDFHDDLTEACRRAKNKIIKKTHPKLKQGYITVTRFTHSYVNQGSPQHLDLNTGSTMNVSTAALSGGPIIDLSLTGLAPQAQVRDPGGPA
ncbi:MAG: hypothetical protein EXS38_08035 [Opitutus sp.]|nr:hypothetical protein [Opitutus sp.]